MTPPSGEGRRYWRSLEECAAAPEFQENLKAEFPRGAAEMNTPFSRRAFLGLMAASAALAGATACRKPEVDALPYTKAPERLLPGVPQHYATSVERAGGDPIGIIVTCHEGRPIKIEGNPDHPASLGAVDPVTQAMVLELYDPDRSQKVLNKNAESSLEAFSAFAEKHFQLLKSKQGEGLAFLSERNTSPTLRAQRERILKEVFPKAEWYTWEPVNDDNALAGMRLAFPKNLLFPQYDLEHADVILSLDCDFLGMAPLNLSQARAFAARRRADSSFHGMNRLYVVEPTMTATGAAADHRVTLAPSQFPLFMQALIDRVMVDPPKQSPIPEGIDPRFLDALAADFKKSSPYVACMAGRHLHPVLHAATAWLNAARGGSGTQFFKNVTDVSSGQLQSLTALAETIRAGHISTLVLLGGNPFYDAPADLDFSRLLAQIPTTIHLGLYANETALRCTWHLPQAHPLETWGDTRTADGTIALSQPLIAPLYNGQADLELLALLSGETQRRAYDIVRAHYQKAQPSGFEEAWRKALHDGVKEKRSPEREPNPFQLINKDIPKELSQLAHPASPQTRGDFELVLLPHPYLHDGRYANSGWLQETPEPITKLSWDNAALLSPTAAARLGVKNEDVVRIEAKDGRVGELPVWIVPGMEDHTVAIHLGYGRSAAGRVGNGRGVNVYPLCTTAYLAGAREVKLAPNGRRKARVTMQIFGQTGGRPLVREVSMAAGAPQHSTGIEPKNGNQEERENQEENGTAQLWQHPLDPNQNPQWAMAIDLSRCIGCHGCVLACQAENNIPIVGKEQIGRGRIMQWLRVDRYFSGSPGHPEGVFFQPVPCQQCETAPCEQVCPVAATVHSPEGLNEMTYNRCVGTRYCSNNCPFKVRRFNFFNYRKGMTPVEKMAMNPDVTVRMRGVMEKCNYCVQRIVRARVAAKAEGRALRDGEVLTACQQACPTNAIVFGNQADPESKIAQLKKDPRNYTLLEDLNLRPRTSYLARLKNPNPQLEKA